MFRRSFYFAQLKKQNSIRPIEVFRTLQLGAFPAPPITRRFLETHFSKELLERNITPTKLQALEIQSCNTLLRQLFQTKFLSVPCRIIAFDVEFTGIPNFTADGPTEEIIELGAYCPVRGKVFSQLIKISEGRKIPEPITKLTGITNEMLDKEGLPFDEGWKAFVDFIETDDWAAVPDEAALELERLVSTAVEGGEASKMNKKEAVADKPKSEEKGDAKKKEGDKAQGENKEGGNNDNKDKQNKNNNHKNNKPQLTTAQINAEAEKSVWYDPIDIVRIPATLPPMHSSSLSSSSSSSLSPSPVNPNAMYKPKVLLMSHGGKLADIAMIEHSLKKHGLRLPTNYKFADTHNIIQDLHQRRPVTQDKHPPSFKLSDLCQWLKTKVPSAIHRAGPDAAMTWSAVFHTMDRYGDESRTPHQQLVLRFFESDAVALMSEIDDPSKKAQHQVTLGYEGGVGAAVGGVDALTSGMDISNTPSLEDDMAILDLDLDSILK